MSRRIRLAGLWSRCIFLLLFIGLHLFPYKFIAYFVRKKLERPGYVFTSFFSGRVSLYQLASTLRKKKKRQIALLPDYVCNVLFRAFRMAGWKVVLYETDKFFEADLSNVKEMIEKFDPGVLVGASVFGSSGLLDLLSNDSLVRILNEKKVDIVLDIAQDVRLVEKLPADSASVHAVVSFNDKSFLGAMGGGVLSSCEIFSDVVKLSSRHVFMLYKWLFLKLFWRYIDLLKSSGRSNLKQSFEYSKCGSFPHEFVVYHVPKIQLILGLIGLSALPFFNKKKAPLLKTDMHLKTRYSSGAAFLIAKDRSIIDGVNEYRRIKRPYAIDSNSAKSLHPELIAIHNKGFMDYV